MVGSQLMGGFSNEEGGRLMVGSCRGKRHVSAGRVVVKSRVLVESRVSRLMAMMLLVAAVASCYPGEINSVGEADLVLTFFDSSADFASIGTYAMPDTIIRVDDDGGSSAANPVVDAQVLAQIEAEFTALGYTRVVVDGAEPDVIVLVTAASAQATPKVQLSTPDQAAPGTMSYTIAKINLQFDEDYVTVELVGENGEQIIIQYISDEGRAVIGAIAVGPGRGLRRFFLQRILRDGRLQGIVEE